MTIAAGWLMDGNGGPALRNVLIRVEQGRIASIGGAGILREDASCFLDLSDRTVLPALLDSHVHVLLSGAEDPSLRRREIQASFPEARETVRRNLNRQWVHGVMALRDGGDRGGHGLQYRKDPREAGSSPVRLLTPGKAWHAQGRYGGIIGRVPGSLGLARSIEESGAEPDHVKIINSGVNSLTEFGKETPPQFSPRELQEAVAAAHRLGLKVMVHANGREAVRGAVEAGADSVEHGYFMGMENLRLLAEKQIPWIPTAFAMEALARSFAPGSLESDTARRTLEGQLEQLRLARDLGVVMALGTDAGAAGVPHGEALLEEMRLLHASGLPWEEVIRCATQTGAHLMGLEQEIGTLAPGRPATFVVARGGPEGLPDSLAFPEGIYVRGVRMGREWGNDA